jgi:hypothetical protein
MVLARWEKDRRLCRGLLAMAERYVMRDYNTFPVHIIAAFPYYRTVLPIDGDQYAL